MASPNALIIIKQKVLTKKVLTFIICLCIASLLWVVHALNLNYKYTLHLPVKFINLPANKLIIGDLPEKLDVEIKTSGVKLFFIANRKHNAELLIDFNTLKTNQKSQAYSISNGNFNLRNIINFNVEILKIRPDTLFFTSNNASTRLIPVKLNLKSNMKHGYVITSKPSINPAFVSVSGDSLEISKIDSIYTNTTILNDVHKNYNSVILLQKNEGNVHYNIKDVAVSFNVDRLTDATINVPIEFINKTTNETIKLLPAFVEIKYLVAMKDYDNIKATSFKAIVNYTEIKDRKKTLMVEIINKPSEIKVLSVSPNTISYLIYK